MSGSAVMTMVASRMIIRYVARMMPRITAGWRVGTRPEECPGARDVKVVVMGVTPVREDG